MTTRVLLISSALFMALLGVGALFLPDDVLAYLGVPGEGVLPVLVQLLGALYLAFAMLNWTAKETLFGGIYNRPAALGNFSHFAIGAITLIRAAAGGQTPPAVWIICVLYTLFAVWFGVIIFFASPVRASTLPGE